MKTGTRVIQTLITVLTMAAFVSGVEARQSGGQDQPDGQPKLTVIETVHDFGKVQPGDRLSHSFKIANEGTAALQIRSVSPG